MEVLSKGWILAKGGDPEDPSKPYNRVWFCEQHDSSDSEEDEEGKPAGPAEITQKKKKQWWQKDCHPTGCCQFIFILFWISLHAVVFFMIFTGMANPIHDPANDFLYNATVIVDLPPVTVEEDCLTARVSQLEHKMEALEHQLARVSAIVYSGMAEPPGSWSDMSYKRIQSLAAETFDKMEEEVETVHGEDTLFETPSITEEQLNTVYSNLIADFEEEEDDVFPGHLTEESDWNKADPKSWWNEVVEVYLRWS